MTNVKGVTMTSNTRSSLVSFDVDPPRAVEPDSHVDGDTNVMVIRVNVMCSWSTGGYSLTPGYPVASIIGDEGERLALTDLAYVPDWLSDVIAAGTPTDLEHPAA